MCSYFMCWGVSFQRISIQKKRDHPFCYKWGGESSKSRIFRDNSEVEFCRKFKSLLWQKITQDFFTSGLVRVLVCFPFHRIHWDLMPVMFMRCFFFFFFFKNITDTLAYPSFTTFVLAICLRHVGFFTEQKHSNIAFFCLVTQSQAEWKWTRGL